MDSTQGLEPTPEEESVEYNLKDLAIEGLEWKKFLTRTSLSIPRDKIAAQGLSENVQEDKQESHVKQPSH